MSIVDYIGLVFRNLLVYYSYQSSYLHMRSKLHVGGDLAAIDPPLPPEMKYISTRGRARLVSLGTMQTL